MAESLMKRSRDAAWKAHVATFDDRPAVSPAVNFAAGWAAAVQQINLERLANPEVSADLIVATYAAHFTKESN